MDTRSLFDAGADRADIGLDDGQVGAAPLELDVPGGQLPLDDALVEVDPGQGAEDGRLLAGLGLQPGLEVLDLAVDAGEALLEVGDALGLGGGRGRGGAGEGEKDAGREEGRDEGPAWTFLRIHGLRLFYPKFDGILTNP